MEIKNNISKLIKPSKPTPSNLRTYDISFFDEQMPNLNTPLILYYPSPQKAQSLVQANVSNRLESSLTETLTEFYQLAGRYMRKGAFVDCNDQGVLYVQAIANFQLSEFLGLTWELKYKMLNDFLPCDIGESGETHDPLLSIKVTTFKCGGLAIGMCFAHKISDMATMSTFIDNWSARNQHTSNNLELGKYSPIFNIAHHFPKQDLHDVSIRFPKSINRAEIMMRVFPFKGITLSKMRERLMSNASGGYRPTKIQLIMSLIWKAFVAIDKVNDEKSKPSCVVLGVNLRNKVIPKLPGNSCGNFLSLAIAQVEPGEGDNLDLQGFLVKVNESIKKVEEDYGKEQTSNNEQHEVLRKPFLECNRNMASNDVNFYAFTSWCKFSFYNADFGWGKPVWISPGKYAAEGLVLLMDDEEGDGIDAWVHLDEKRMRLLEQDHDIQACAS